MLSARSRKLVAKPSPIQVAHARCASDPFHLRDNPEGYINLGTAENYLVWDLMGERLRACQDIVESDVHYQPPAGTFAFRGRIAAFLNRQLGAEAKAEELVVAVGATSILDMLAFSLCEPGEGILIPAPYYPGFDTDLAGRSEAVPVAAPLRSADGFLLTEEALEEGLRRARERGIRVKALLVANPGNPVGKVLTTPELEAAMRFLQRHQLQGIFDEIYAGSVFAGPRFESVFALRRRYPDLAESLHFVYGLSKDFTLSGLRVGIYHGTNVAVRQAMQALAYFHGVPGDTQRLLTTLFSDEAWVDRYLIENQNRLRASFESLRERLGRRTDARVFPAQAGVFAWLDLRHALATDDFESEKALGDRILSQARVSILPGAVFHGEEPGWFRLCFAHPAAILETAVERLSQVL